MVNISKEEATATLILKFEPLIKALQKANYEYNEIGIIVAAQMVYVSKENIPYEKVDTYLTELISTIKPERERKNFNVSHNAKYKSS